MFFQPTLTKPVDKESRNKTYKKFAEQNQSLPLNSPDGEQLSKLDKKSLISLKTGRNNLHSTDINDPTLRTINTLTKHKKGIILTKDLWGKTYSNKLLKLCGLHSMHEKKGTLRRTTTVKTSI